MLATFFRKYQKHFWGVFDELVSLAHVLYVYLSQIQTGIWYSYDKRQTQSLSLSL